MSNTYEQLVAAGAENCHPIFVATVGGEKQVVARAVDGTIYLTDAGKKFLSAKPEKAAEPKAPRKKQAAEPVAEPAATDADLSIGDVNLDA